MRVVNFVVLAPLFLAAVNAFAASPENWSPVLAQSTTTTSPNSLDAPNPNSLDAQGRLRDRERERAHDEVRERLGDRSPGATTTGQGFTAPTTNDKSDVPSVGPKSNQNRER